MTALVGTSSLSIEAPNYEISLELLGKELRQSSQAFLRVKPSSINASLKFSFSPHAISFAHMLRGSKRAFRRVMSIW